MNLLPEIIYDVRKALEDEEAAYLSGEVVYQLRCSVLHQGVPNIDKSQIKEETCKIDNFRIVIEPKNQFDVYADGSATWSNFGSDETVISYDVNLRRLCNSIIWCAEAYLRENKEKFDFFRYSIIEYGFGEECKD